MAGEDEVIDLTDNSVAVATVRRPDDDEVIVVSSTDAGNWMSQVTFARARSNVDSDFALALQLAAQEPSCSQSLPKRRRKSRRFDCAICLADNMESFKGYSLEACGHRFCGSCLIGLVQSSLTSNASVVLKIDCPQVNCRCGLSLNDIRYILRDNPAAWTQYSEAANLCALEAEVLDDGSNTRRCPSQRCNYIFTFVPGTASEGRHFTCPSCLEQFCLQCGANRGKVGPPHEGRTCADQLENLQQQAEERRKFQEWEAANSKADERFAELLASEAKAGATKPCPQCKMPITKNGGCDHMYCTACKRHFNWSSGK